MARQIRWQVSFKSLNGTNCRIDIYEDGWSGGITAVTPAANPFIYEEDDTDSLLDVIRVKTAYLRVKEEHYNDLYDLYPQTNTEHYVEAYYGYSIFFSGFMQAQSFEVSYEPGPRVLEFPISSPLGVLGGKDMPTPASPSYVTLAEAIRQAANVIDANISSVVFPDYMLSSNFRTLDTKINTLSYCPFNDDYDLNYHSTTPLYTPISISNFLENLCNCFGLVVHDLPGMLVFSRYDYEGIYSQYTLETMAIRDITSGSQIFPTTLWTSISTNGTEKTVLPIHKLTINYDDEIYPDYEIPYNRAKIKASSDRWALLEARTDEFSTLYPASSMPTTISNDVAMCAICGQDNLSSFQNVIMFSGWNFPGGVFTWKLYNIPKYSGYGCTLTFTVSIVNWKDDAGLTPFYEEDSPVKGKRIGILYKNGNYYYDFAGNWTAAGSIHYRTTDDNGYYEQDLPISMYDYSKPVEVTIFLDGWDITTPTLFIIKDVKISRTPLGIYSYRGESKDSQEITNANGSTDEAEIGQTFNVYRNSEDALIMPDGSMEQMTACTYGYMFQAQHRITLDVRTTPSVLHYLNKINIGNTVLKRIVGFSFDFWNDRATIIAQGTTTL